VLEKKEIVSETTRITISITWMDDFLSSDSRKLSLKFYRVTNNIMENVFRFSLLFVKSLMFLKIDLYNTRKLIEMTIRFNQTSIDW
jgi:hypothetical protein